MKRFILRSAFLLIVCGLIINRSTAGQDRYHAVVPPKYRALVVATATYANLPGLKSTLRDGESVGRKLDSMNFDVTIVNGISSYNHFSEDVAKFAANIDTGDVVLIYFTGHGFSYNSRNWLAPSDLPSKLLSSSLDTVAVAVEDVARHVSDRQPGFIFLVVDACRSIANYVDLDSAAGGRFDSAVAQVANTGAGVNTLVGYAVGPGKAAKGYDSLTQSRYTSRFVRWIDTKGRSAVEVLRDIRDDLADSLPDNELPGLSESSSASLYLLPSTREIAQQDSAWNAALSDSTRSAVARFLRRFSTSHYTRAARLWLDDHKDITIADAFTQLRAGAVDDAWNKGSNGIAFRTNNIGLAFSRSVEYPSSSIGAQKGLEVFGAVSSGASPSVLSARALRERLATIDVTDTLVTTKPFVARSAPQANSNVVRQINANTRLQLLSVQQLGANDIWATAKMVGSEAPVFLQLTQTAEPPVELGRALDEVFVSVGGAPELVNPLDLQRKISELRKSGLTITWVSISTSSPTGTDEADVLASRVVHAKFIMKQLGISGRKITDVTSAPDLARSSVRVRFFGY